MSNRNTRIPVALLVLLTGVSLAGCGGGSSSGPKAVAITPGPTGKAVTVFVPSGTLQVSGTQNRTVSVRVNGDTATAGVGGLSALGAMQRVTTVSAASTAQIYKNANAQVAVVTAAGTDVLTDASYGIVSQNTPNGTYFGGYHQGTPTSAAQVPTNVQATYRGEFVGLYYEDKTLSTQGLVGTSSLTADFAAGTVTGSVTNLNRRNLFQEQYALKVDGKITGNSYSGTTRFVQIGGTGAPVGSVRSSEMQGRFYGANASQTAGTLRVEGQAPTVAGLKDVTIVGGFGATKR